MTAPTTAAWEAYLPSIRDELLLSARAHPKTPASRVLDNGWRFQVSVTAAGRIGYRFRCWNDGKTVQLDFLLQARRYAFALGAGHWKLVESTRGAFLEALFLSPGEPPASKEVA